MKYMNIIVCIFTEKFNLGSEQRPSSEKTTEIL